jgi:thiol-disulfide isomerase/thioredoxin
LKNKFIFLLCLFVLSATAAYAYVVFDVDRALEYYNQKQQGFAVPSVPKKQTDAFARHFADMQAATEPMFLPDSPFLDMDGKKRTLADFRGKPVLVNLWARWCAPCIVELPSLQDMAKRYAGKIEVVAIAMEQGKEPKDIADFLEKRSLGDFAGYLDKNGEFATKLGLRGIPTSFLLGSNGQILYRFEGDAEWLHPDATEFFDVFLLQSP